MTAISTHSESANVVLVISSLQGGGAERQIADMANYWAAKGLTVTLATWSGPQTNDFYSVDNRVRRVHLEAGAERCVFLPGVRANWRRMLQLRQLLSFTRPDAVLSFVTETNVLAILASAGLGARVVVSERVQPALHVALPLQWRVLRRVLYAWSDEVVAQTQDAVRWIAQNCRKKAVVIPNALRLLPEPSTGREPLIVAVGRLTKQKGFDLLLRAFAGIAPTFRDWNVAIIGEGSERPNLLRLRDELALADRVEFVGQTRDVLTWMARAGIVVQPSRFEGFPNVVLEAMGMGAAVISADCPSGPADLIESGVNGCLVPVEDVGALMNAMAELIAQSELRERLGREASKVRQRFRQELIMARWEACLFSGSGSRRANDGASQVDCK